MNKKIFLIDPLEKLDVKKDGTLLWALTGAEKGHDCYLLFEKDLSLTDLGLPLLKLWKFEGHREKDSFYLSDFKLTEDSFIQLEDGDDFYMRLDPPFDSRYLKILWMLTVLSKRGMNVSNSPEGILNYNEKILPLLSDQDNGATFIGGSIPGMKDFLKRFPDQDDFIIKPLDLYQGIGVQKISKTQSDFWQVVEQKIEEFKGTAVLQPFNEKIKEGEYRSVYFKAVEIGTIIKVPPKDSFLANIAQGANYHKIDLPLEAKRKCDEMAKDLLRDGVELVAFDVLGDYISEANITCPGLLVEVSTAMGKNLCEHFFD